MKRLTVLVVAFVAGAYTMLAIVDRLFGGRAPRITFDEPGGGWGQ
jgi:hypothetical protein